MTILMGASWKEIPSTVLLFEQIFYTTLIMHDVTRKSDIHVWDERVFALLSLTTNTISAPQSLISILSLLILLVSRHIARCRGALYCSSSHVVAARLLGHGNNKDLGLMVAFRKESSWLRGGWPGKAGRRNYNAMQVTNCEHPRQHLMCAPGDKAWRRFIAFFSNNSRLTP
jgi:hypothetical protein